MICYKNTLHLGRHTQTENKEMEKDIHANGNQKSEARTGIRQMDFKSKNYKKSKVIE